MATHTFVHESSDEELIGVAGAFRREAIGPMAAGIGLFTLMTLPPALLAIAAIYGLVASPQLARAHAEWIAHFAPDQAAGFVRDVLVHVVAASPRSLGLAAFGAIGIALLATQRSMSATMSAINAIARLDEKRSFVRRQATAFGLGVAGIATLALALVGLVALPSIGRVVGWDGGTWRFYAVARWPAAFLLVWGYLALVYRHAPAHWSMTWTGAIGGAAAGAALWVLVSFGLSLWLDRVGHYEALYGAAGSVLIVMLWAYLSAYAGLIGALIAAAARDRRQRAMLVDAAWSS